MFLNKIFTCNRHFPDIFRLVYETQPGRKIRHTFVKHQKNQFSPPFLPSQFLPYTKSIARQIDNLSHHCAFLHRCCKVRHHPASGFYFSPSFNKIPMLSFLFSLKATKSTPSFRSSPFCILPGFIFTGTENSSPGYAVCASFTGIGSNRSFS